jgi:hypothetical protein
MTRSNWIVAGIVVVALAILGVAFNGLHSSTTSDSTTTSASDAPQTLYTAAPENTPEPSHVSDTDPATEHAIQISVTHDPVDVNDMLNKHLFQSAEISDTTATIGADADLWPSSKQDRDLALRSVETVVAGEWKKHASHIPSDGLSIVINDLAGNELTRADGVTLKSP